MITVTEARELTLAKKNKRIEEIKKMIDEEIEKAGKIGRNYTTIYFNDDIDVKEIIKDYYINLGYNYSMFFEIVDKRVTANLSW